ncbi:hypothetical protein MUN89_02585 [Halobacillus salinarum]|uniref:Uncharacterized protein n=1 Tax=Halobacillus salinarum TaxID=2932257 RepID=A0ABY4EK54_9BACI|nr:hypothetical protein [Halobacillus salinarum]UOQ44860.1 hypothetical protein MUN89_02585 [Halobacillus salinarum]
MMIGSVIIVGLLLTAILFRIDKNQHQEEHLTLKPFAAFAKQQQFTTMQISGSLN